METHLGLLDVFTLRPNRFRLLDKGINLLTNASINKLYILEVGCAYGDGSAHLAKKFNCLTEGIDISEKIIAEAKDRHKDLISQGKLDFEVGDAENLPYGDETVDILFSEAAFSPIINKRNAASEYHRVLKKGGFLLINDFATKAPVYDENRNLYHIPCFQGVNTIEYYTDIFIKQDFHIVSAKEEYGELLGISMWVSKYFNIDIKEIGTYLSQFYNLNRTGCNCNEEGRILKDVKLTYCQMILKK